MNLNSFLLRTLLPLSLAACGLNGIDPRELKPVSSKEEFRLTTPLRYQYGAVERGVVPAVFQSVSVDAAGTFFVCDARCVWDRHLAGPPTNVYPGGIYVPNDKSMPPRLFRIFTESEQTVDNLNDYIQQRTTTNIVQGAPVGSTVLGGVIADGIVGAAIKASIGRHLVFEQSPDPTFLAALTAAVAKRQLVSDAPAK
jgi:hypothetical protein